MIEDGPTVTHGGMKYGAGIVAARRFGAAEIIDPRPYVMGTIAGTCRAYPAMAWIRRAFCARWPRRISTAATWNMWNGQAGVPTGRANGRTQLFRIQQHIC